MRHEAVEADRALLLPLPSAKGWAVVRVVCDEGYGGLDVYRGWARLLYTRENVGAG